jgi:hypothetical protein
LRADHDKTGHRPAGGLHCLRITPQEETDEKAENE